MERKFFSVRGARELLLYNNKKPKKNCMYIYIFPVPVLNTDVYIHSTASCLYFNKNEWKEFVLRTRCFFHV